MFLTLQSGNNICLAHIVSVFSKPGETDSVSLELSNGRKITITGTTADSVKKEITEAFSIAANNTSTYMQFEKYSDKILEALSSCETLMTEAGRASEITNEVMQSISKAGTNLTQSISALNKPTNRLSDEVSRLKVIIDD